MAKRIHNADLEVIGTINVSSVSNATGDVIILDAFNQLAKRTYAEILTDIGAIGDAPSDGTYYARLDGAWATFTPGAGGSSTLGGLDDVVLTAPATNEVLQYDGSDWVNAVVTGDKTFTFTQGLPSATWNINHALNKYPSVTVVDSSNEVVVGNIEYTDANNLIVTFSAAFSGRAELN